MTLLARQHNAIWTAIDRLADRHGLSPSGLAMVSGLDSTAFNKSKRIHKNGSPRWPSTCSIARILNATGNDYLTFGRLITIAFDQSPSALSMSSQTQAPESPDEAAFVPSGRPRQAPIQVEHGEIR